MDMSERGEEFDAKKAAYEAANEKLLRLTEMPDKTVSVEDYKAQIRKALAASRRAHKALLEAW